MIFPLIVILGEQKNIKCFYNNLGVLRIIFILRQVYISNITAYWCNKIGIKLDDVFLKISQK